MLDILLDPEPTVAPKAAPSVTHLDALPPGTRLAEFEVIGLLGVGGFGLVYRAYDHNLQRAVAIKEYMPAALAARMDGLSVVIRSSNDQATYDYGLQSFVAEARLLAQFDHPSLVKVYRFWEANNTAYMVMPLYSGMTLKQARTQMVAPPPEAWLRTVLWSVLQGLHVLHRSDTLHRDISPDNIFLQDVGPPVLLDLGASRRAINDKDHKFTAVLKVNYAPIEQYAEAEDLRQGPWTDLYALAAVVYSCLRNDPPLPATARVVRDTLPPLRSVVQTVKTHFGLDYSDAFVRTITRALAVQPADRPQSLAAFVTEMKLKAPPRLNKFDWRAELGATLRGDEDEHHSRQFWHTEPQELPAANPQTPRRVSRWTWGLAGSAAAVLLGVLAYRGLGGDAPQVPPPEPAAMPAPVSSPPPEPPPPPEAVATPAPPPMVASPVPRAADSRPAPVAVTKPATPPQLAAPIDDERKPPTRVARPAPVEPAPRPAPAAAGASTAKKELCASANFFTRPMCIHLECQKAENTALPVCVENRQRYPDGPNASPS